MGSWVKRPDSWHFGIPNFTGLYTYFYELTEEGGPLTHRKHLLWARATAEAKKDIDKLQVHENIKQANNFLALVAESERAKEINMITTFCKQTGKKFPLLAPYLENPILIDTNLDDFYTSLTTAINEVRKSTQDYHTELLRIKQNMEDASRTLASYKEDDYRYRLNNDINSFLNRITGNFQVSVDSTSTFSQKVQSLTLRILEKMNIGKQIQSAEDFAAIAAATLIDVERQIQKELDSDRDSYIDRRKLDAKITDILDKVEQHYTNIASKAEIAESPVEKALSNINGAEFIRIVKNAKDILNIETSTKSSSEIDKLNNRIRKRDERAKQKNKNIHEIRQQVKSLTNSKNLNLVTFQIEGSAQSQHGNIYELIETIFQEGFKVSGNMATDIITYTIGWDVKQDNTALASLSEEIGKIYTDAYTQLQSIPKGEIRDTREILNNMNKEIDKLIRATEKNMQDLKELDLDNMFIFHESLKLSSSAETGRNKQNGGFSGRNMSIMSYIDSLYTMSDSMTMPLDRTALGFLSLNLVPGAVAESMKEPLEQYLSLYAGMVMFDDLANMAKEAASMINAFSPSGKIMQIHLYNLNGIYVPASMILSYISDAVDTTYSQIVSDAAAKVTITASANQTYAQYLTIRNSGNPFNLTPDTWQSVAADSASNTKISITFLASFKAFIEKLSSSIGA